MSNLCDNNCMYCGFRDGNSDEVRSKLSMDQVKAEAEVLAGKIGHKRLIVVYGEHPSTSTDYIKMLMMPTCYVSDPGPPAVWSPMDTNLLRFNITGASSTDCTLLFDDGGGRFNLWVEDDDTTVFGPGTTYFAMQGIDGTSSVSTTDPIGTNESFYIVCF